MWRLQHGISPKTTKDPFVLCHHAELEQSKVMFHVAPMKSQYALMACSTVSTTPCCICPTVKDRRAPPSSCILHSTSLILHPSHGFLILPPAMNQCPIRYATMQKSLTYHRSAIDPATTAIAEVHLTRKPSRLHKNTSCVKAPSLAISSTDRLLCSLAKCTMSCCFSTWGAPHEVVLCLS